MKSIQQFLQEGYLLNDKDISIDLHKFVIKSNKKLIIVGHAGSGKTSIGKILEKKYKVPIYSTDNIAQDVRHELNLYDVDEVTDELNDKTDELIFNRIKKLLTSSERCIIEGVGVMDPGLRKYILNSTMIIMGRSALYSAFKGASRKRGGNRSWTTEFWILSKHNIKKIEKELNTIRNTMTKNKSKTILEYE